MIRVPAARGRRRSPSPGIGPDGSIELLESQIEQTCTEFLQAHGWRAFKMESTFSREKRKGVGEFGMSDRLYLRYKAGEKLVPETPLLSRIVQLDQVLWIEWKRIRRGRATKATQHQIDWITAERARGALVWIAGVDFPATIDGFRAFYGSYRL